MAVTAAVSVGMRVTHTMHGDGRVLSISPRVNRATGLAEDYAAVNFPAIRGTGKWSLLVSGLPSGDAKADEGLTVLVRLADLAAGDKWHLAEDYGDLSDVLGDIERLPADSARFAPAEGCSGTARLLTLARAIEDSDRSPHGDPVNVLKFIVDWSAERHVRRIAAVHGRATRLARAEESLALAASRNLWATKLHPQLPEQLRPAAERVLLSVAALLGNWFDAGHGEAARMVTAAAEARVANLHLPTLRLFLDSLRTGQHMML